MPPSGARDAISGIVALRRVVVRVRSVRSFLRSFFPPFAVNEALPKHVVDDAAADGREGHPGNLGGDSSRQKTPFSVREPSRLYLLLRAPEYQIYGYFLWIRLMRLPF